MADSFIKYRYFLTDLVTNEILAEIPFTGVSYERALKSAGSFSGNIPISDETIGLDLYNVTMPGKTGLYVTRNGTCVWGGIIWSRDYNVVSKEMSVSASEFTSYLHHRRLWKSWMRNYPNIVVTRWDGDRLKVSIKNGDKITINDGATVELLFDQYRAFDYRGHYKVIGNYYNASFFFVQDVPEEAFTGNPIAFDGNYRADQSRKVIKKTFDIASRTVTSGKKAVTLKTTKPHGLVPGDTVAISGLDEGIGLADYTVTTGDSAPLTMDMLINAAGSDYGMAGDNTFNRKYTVTIPDLDLGYYRILVNPSDPTDATLTIMPKINRFGFTVTDNPPTPGDYYFPWWSVYWSPSLGDYDSDFNTTDYIRSKYLKNPDGGGFMSVAEKYGFRKGMYIQLLNFTISGEGSGVPSGSEYLDGPWQISDSSGELEWGPQYAEGGMLRISSISGLLKFKLPNTRTWENTKDPNYDPALFRFIPDDSWFKFPDTGGPSMRTKAGYFETGQKIVISELDYRSGSASTNKSLVDFTAINDATVVVEDATPTGFTFHAKMKSRPSSLNLRMKGVGTRVVHWSSTTKNVAADELNISDAVIASVPSANSFVVNSTKNSSITSTKTQKKGKAKVTWTAAYPGSMNANTDIYDYVRTLLGHVFTDFHGIDYYSSYTGNTLASGIRKISYNEDTATTRVETGFIESAISKQMLRDVTNVTYASIENNLAKLVLSVDSYVITSIVPNTVLDQVTYYATNDLKVGDKVCIAGITSPDAYNVDEAVVIEASSSYFKISSTATGTEVLGANPRAYKFIPYSAGDEITISGVDSDLDLGQRRVLDITTKIDEVVNYKTINFSVSEESTITSTAITGGSVTGLPYVRLTLPAAYNQFYNDYLGGISDVGRYVRIYGLDTDINGIFTIKKIDPDKTWFEYYISKDLQPYDEVKLPRDETTVVFGEHQLVPGSSARISGLSDYNYDGSFIVGSTPNDVVFEYQKEFKTINVVEYRSKRNSTGTSTIVQLRIDTPPSTVNIARGTRIRISNVPILADGVYTVSKYYDPEDLSVKYTDKLDKSKYYVEITIPGITTQVCGPTLIDLPDRLKGDPISISSAAYVINKKGVGTTTYTLESAHGLTSASIGKSMYISNVGGNFTQKVGLANAYSSMVVKITAIPSSTKVSTDQQGLYAYKNNLTINKVAGTKIAKSNTSVSGVTGASYQLYTTTAVPVSNAATIQVTDLSTYTSDNQGASARKHSVIGKMFDSESTEVTIYTAAAHGFKTGESVTVVGVDSPGTTEGIFDGLHRITKIGKDKIGYFFTYFGDGAFKKDIGLFSKKTAAANDPARVRLVFDDANDEVAYAVVEPSVFGASYGPFTKNANIGIKFSTYDYAGAYNSGESYRGHEMTVVGEALDKFADKFIVKPGGSTLIRNVMGFEYRIDCDYDEATNSFTRTFVFIPISFPDPPALGSTSPISRFNADKTVFEYPGNISGITLQESAEEASTRFWMVGSDGGTGTADAAKSYVGVADTELLKSGWPILDQVETNDQINYLDDLTDYAKRYLSETRPPMGVFDVSVNGSYDPTVVSYKPGDWCTIIINDKFVQQRLASDFEPRNDVIIRKIISYSVDVPDGNAYPESVKLTLLPEWEVDKKNG